jgi:Flp pilus assembly protein TadD
MLRIDDSDERRARTAEAAERALALEPDLARGHLAMAVYLAHGARDQGAALAELAIARRERPADSEVLEWQARLLAGEGRFDEAIAALVRAVEVNPTEYPARCLLGAYLTHVRRHPDADAEYRRAIALQPDRMDAYLGRIWNALVWQGGTDLARQGLGTMPLPSHRDALELEIFLLFAERRFDRALELIQGMPASRVESAHWWWPSELLECHAHHWLLREEDARRACTQALADAQAALELRPHDPRLWTSVGYSQALLGNRAEAIGAAERACAVAPPNAVEQDQFRRDLLAIAAIAGDADRAIEEIRAALARPGYLTAAWLAVDWRYDRLRSDPRFKALEATGSKG